MTGNPRWIEHWEGVTLGDRFVAELPGDPSDENRPRQVSGACYSRVSPLGSPSPQLVAYSLEMVEELGLSNAAAESPDFTDILSGNALVRGMDPYAMCYGGHQFGQWAGQLGDGRAINLGEVVGPKGRWTLQLKGAGPTPYSRTADGFAVLRSSVREFLCSEAMAHLGIPTTRALSLVTTGQPVTRDLLYDGHPRDEPGAIVCRASSCFLRFGNFEIFASRGELGPLKTLLDFAIRHWFSDLGEPEEETYYAWFDEVCRRTMDVVVGWMRVGFVHGVLNTDNMSILGETIDYGPYGWQDHYDPDWTPNTTDAVGRRYRFGAQPQVAQWNLYQLARAIASLVTKTDPLQKALESFPARYHEASHEMMLEKLGLTPRFPDEDRALLEELDRLLRLVETDRTLFYRALATEGVGRTKEEADDDRSLLQPLNACFYDDAWQTDEYVLAAVAWLRQYRARIEAEGCDEEERARRMNRVNPLYLPRNYLVQEAIEKAEQGDPSLVQELLDVVRRPYEEQSGRERFAGRRPEWARHRPGCSMLSCSS